VAAWSTNLKEANGWRWRCADFGEPFWVTLRSRLPDAGSKGIYRQFLTDGREDASLKGPQWPSVLPSACPSTWHTGLVVVRRQPLERSFRYTAHIWERRELRLQDLHAERHPDVARAGAAQNYGAADILIKNAGTTGAAVLLFSRSSFQFRHASATVRATS
jgi:hypothetical protein